ncbi:DUF418 domain-containing protein [Aneurinibacillus aneurinilyticus]|uniref:DUF418 domain-containing protein n=1 Tax=Aneurinibacillus aneurinilyticus TaxID=1391 RepID=UPI0023F1A4C8|nr:DUF418 domain-containing protein [Aneurinibacillus aneurinilyticus]
MLTPITGQERIASLDIIRGFALFGIFLVNFPSFHPADYPALMFSLDPGYTGLDRGIRLFYDMFVQTKFYTIFSFLFGLGFYIFMERAEKRGLSVYSLFTRRLLALLVFGLLHLIFFWYGDILHTYALAGFMLLLFYRRRNGIILAWAFGLLIFILSLTTLPLFFSDELYGSLQQEQQALGQQEIKKTMEIYEHASYLEWVAYRFSAEVSDILSNAPLTVASILPLFLFGLYAGRKEVFHEPAHHTRFIWVTWLGTLMISIPLVSMVFAVEYDIVSFGIAKLDAKRLFIQLSGLTLCFFYMSSLLLLMRNKLARTLLAPLGYTGRMALTNYLGQTIIALILMRGFGLFETFTLSIGLIICIAVYALQILFSFYWLRFFRFGPLEWIWRSITYGALQPIKIVDK